MSAKRPEPPPHDPNRYDADRPTSPPPPPKKQTHYTDLEVDQANEIADLRRQLESLHFAYERMGEGFELLKAQLAEANRECLRLHKAGSDTAEMLAEANATIERLRRDLTEVCEFRHVETIRAAIRSILDSETAEEGGEDGES